MCKNVEKLQRQELELSAFLGACPARPSLHTDPLAALRDGLPALRSLLEQFPHLCDADHRAALESCLYDITADQQPLDAFIEFGLWTLDRCAEHGFDAVFGKTTPLELEAFLKEELFRYSVLRKRHQIRLIPNSTLRWCAQEWCGRPGRFCCSHCLKTAQRRVVYCSHECQQRHWETHRRSCGQHREHGTPEELHLNAYLTLQRMPSLSDETGRP